MSDDLLCKGCWSLGTACGDCARCRESTSDALRKIREQEQKIGQLYDQIGELELLLSDTMAVMRECRTGSDYWDADGFGGLVLAAVKEAVSGSGGKTR